MNKTAIVIFSDPKNGGDEALGRAFNGLAAAYGIKQLGGEISVIFQGAGARWISLITQADHPLHGLYQLVEGNISGVSCGCADFFGATGDVKACGVELLSDILFPARRVWPASVNY